MVEPTKLPIDEFHGQGGSYIVGPDGKRQLVERTQPPAPEAIPPSADSPDA